MGRHSRPRVRRRRSVSPWHIIGAAVVVSGAMTAWSLVPVTVEDVASAPPFVTSTRPPVSTTTSPDAPTTTPAPAATTAGDAPDYTPSGARVTPADRSVKPSRSLVPKTAPPKPSPKPTPAAPPASASGKGSTTTTPVPSGKGVTAAERYGWGSPTSGDEFNYTGKPKSELWSVYDGAGHAGNGRRTPDAITVDGSKLVMSGDSRGNTGGMAAKFDRRQYGRWEARVRSYGEKDGHQYHPLLLIWPDSNKRVRDGEYDFMENGAPGESCIEAFMHYPGETPKKQAHFEHCDFPGTLADWRYVAFEWTPDGLTGFLDGRQWFHTHHADIAEMPSGHLCIQLDGFHGSSGYAPARLEVDWVRYWAL